MVAPTRAALTCALVVVGLAAGRGTSAPASPAVYHARLTWAGVVAGLRPTLDPSSANPCQRGSLSCLDILLGEMQRRARPLVAACSHDAPFAVTYEAVTAAVRAAARSGRFHNPALLTLFSAWFAQMYFQAFDNWRAGRHGAVSTAWQVAFGTADGRKVTGIGDMLLGLNAHITHDLPNVVADVMREPGTAVNPDYALVSQIITGVSPSVLRDIGNHLDASVSLAQIPIELGGAASLGALIAQWRTESWRNGMALRAAAPAARAAVEQRVAATADLRAALIRSATAYLPFIESSTPRDAYCASHH